MSLADRLKIDPQAVADRIAASIVEFMRDMKRRGAVLGLSGGIDSSVTAALCVRALGVDRVLGLFMPEAESSPESLRLARLLGGTLGIASELEDIAGILREAGCYKRRDDAIRTVVPEYGDGYKCKIVLPNLMDESAYRIFSIVVRSPTGVETKTRLTLSAYLTVVAATNFKQRTRKMLEYFHADRLNYAVAGTPNLVEYDQGFFVKNGDGAADFKPIAHLYKSQIYALAEYLGIPEEITRREPTTDTYSLSQSQEEFYFSVPYRQMDMAMVALDHAISADDAAGELSLSAEHARRLFKIIEDKRKASRYLNAAPVLVS